MAACAPISPLAGSAETMVGTVDCYMQTYVQSGYANLLGPGSLFSYGLTVALTLYVALVGYRLIFGRSTLSMGEMMPRMVLIGAVLALTSNWATYQVLVYDVLTDGPQEIVSAINPGVGKAITITERVDVLSNRMVDLADAWTEFDARPEAAMPADMPAATPTEPDALPPTVTGITALVAPKDSLGPNMLLLSALLLVLASAGVLVIAKIILGLLLLLGPVFAILALFAGTRGLTLGWARAAVLMALVPIMAMMTSAGVVALLEPVLTEMYVSASQGLFSLRSALAILVVVLIMVAVSVQLFRIGRTIVGGWVMSFGQAPSRAVEGTPVTVNANQNELQPSNVIYNERMQSLIGSIERSAMAATSVSPATQRSVYLPHRFDGIGEGAPSRQDTPSSDRRIARGRVTAVRAPVKAIRNAA
jgi:type IV secretion system protein VirB6